MKTKAREKNQPADIGSDNDALAVRKLKRTIAQTQGHLASLLRVLDGKDDAPGDIETDPLVLKY
jgi:hypothetical protein